jgi:hypothetical protein
LTARRQRPDQELDQADRAAVGVQQVPVAVDGNGGKRLLLRQHVADSARDLGKLRRAEIGLAPCRGVAGRQQQRVVLAQGHVERLGEAQDHLPARTRAAKLQKAQMALRDLCPAGKLQLG